MSEQASEQRIDPITVRISTAVRITGLSRSRIYDAEAPKRAAFVAAAGALSRIAPDGVWRFSVEKCCDQRFTGRCWTYPEPVMVPEEDRVSLPKILNENEIVWYNFADTVANTVGNSLHCGESPPSRA
jgi:hypothetical protein